MVKMITKSIGFVERKVSEGVNVISPILRPSEAAGYLGVSLPMLDKLGIKAIRKGKLKRYRVEQLSEFMSDET